MDAYPSQIIQFFNGFRQSVIPLFQRPYEWQEKRWNELWQDILERYESNKDSSHFLGTIVTLPSRSNPVGVVKHLIIDGQQRLITLALLLCAIRDKLPNDSVEHVRIQNYYLFNVGYDGYDNIKILPTQDDRENFLEIMKRIENKKPSLMHSAYIFFLKKIESSDSDSNPIEVKRLLETIEQKLNIVNINLGDSDNPHLIFESLNYKGTALTPADLVRNYFLMRFPVIEQDKIYKDLWLPMQRRLGEHLTEFMRHYLMRDGNEILKNEVYSELKKRLQDLEPEEVKTFLAEMNTLSEYYLKIISPEEETDPDLRKYFTRLFIWDVTTAYPLLLKFYEAYAQNKIDKDDFCVCLKSIESFIVRREVCNVPTNQLKRIFLQASTNFKDSNTWYWLRKELGSGSSGGRWPKDAEFKEAWLGYKAYRKGKRCRLIMEAIEESYEHKELADLESASIEHIMPQTLTDEWRKMLDTKAEEIIELYGDTVGNLTLTAYNSELSNLSFNEKKKFYANSHYSLNSYFASKDKWTDKEILERAEILWNKARTIWPSPPG